MAWRNPDNDVTQLLDEGVAEVPDVEVELSVASDQGVADSVADYDVENKHQGVAGIDPVVECYKQGIREPSFDMGIFSTDNLTDS